ncbi:hypothetical protein [Natronoglycomyces albus]|uniref:Uncharacterized protein n=1 Tax=Natronoglycomyces albus TaxID=2811108 RepID=A0A895XQY6_9ACTN|nr:hypothetical protein [Natronoglycomyces albus]QSB03988.1 hypothetical protein JQS30_09140 [Natronoglycomyces albus]
MAYPPPQQQMHQPAGPPPRPGVVTAAVWLMYATAISLVISGIGFISMRGEVRDLAESAIRESGEQLSASDMEMIDTVVLMMLVLVAILLFVFASFYAILALLNSKAKRPARILTWILASIGLACCGLPGAFGQRDATMQVSSGDEQVEAEVMEAFEQAIPAWLEINEYIQLGLLLLGSILIIVFLALPAANQFFRKQPPAGGMPPGYPPHGYPPAGPNYPPQGPNYPPHNQGPTGYTDTSGPGNQ